MSEEKPLMGQKTFLLVVAILTGIGGGGVGTLAGGARAEEKIAQQSERLAKIEATVHNISEQVKANAVTIEAARKANKETVEKVHAINIRTERILTILEEREKKHD